MEIIHVVLGKANPERMNGVNKVVHELAERQAARGQNVSVWGISASTDHNYPPRSYITRLFRRRPFPFLLPASLVAAVHEATAGSVFHLHGGFLPQMYSLSRLLHRLGIPYVFTPHGSYNAIAMKKNRLVKRIYCLLFEHAMLRKAATIHVLGQTEQDSLRAWNKHWKITRIPYGFDASPEQVTVAGKHQGTFIAGFCGRIDIHTKGLDALIEGFTLFHKEHPDSELRIIGDGREMPALKSLVRQSAAEDAIVLYGPKYGTEKEALLLDFEIFVHPSRNEGLPAAVLEAAAAGIPCLVTRATNTGDAVSSFDAGVTLEHTHKLEVYQGLKALYTKIREEQAGPYMAAQARQMVRTLFNWERLLEKFDHLYQGSLL